MTSPFRPASLGAPPARALAAPGYLFDLFRTRPIAPENFTHLTAPIGGLPAFFNSQFDRTITWKDAEWMAAQWGGPMAIKGVCTPADARACLDAGASAVWVSNHGGRQLDTCAATVDLLPGVVEAVGGRGEVIFDGGVRRGVDVIKALALGATSVALGRAYLYGLAAGGYHGVNGSGDHQRRTRARPAHDGRFPMSPACTPGWCARPTADLAPPSAQCSSAGREARHQADRPITRSSTTWPPIRCSWIMRSRPWGVQSQYQTPSG